MHHYFLVNFRISSINETASFIIGCFTVSVSIILANIISGRPANGHPMKFEIAGRVKIHKDAPPKHTGGSSSDESGLFRLDLEINHDRR